MKSRLFACGAAIGLMALATPLPGAVLVSNLEEPIDPVGIYTPGEGIAAGELFTTDAAASLVSVTFQQVLFEQALLTLPSYHLFVLKVDRSSGMISTEFVGECLGLTFVALDTVPPSAFVTYTPTSSIALEPLTEYIVAVGDLFGSGPSPRFLLAGSGALGGDVLGFKFGSDVFWGESFWPGCMRVGIEVTPTSTSSQNRPPDVSGAYASVKTVWPPNGKMIPFSVEGVVDPDGDSVAIKIVRIDQDEPVTTPGADKSAPDAVVSADNAGSVRAERLGSRNGRVYRILFTADDGQPGGLISGEVFISVPHDAASAALDDGPVSGYFDSTAR